MTFLGSLEEFYECLLLVDLWIFINMINNVSNRFKIITEGHPVKASIPGQTMDILKICPVDSFVRVMLEALRIFFSIHLFNQQSNHFGVVFSIFLEILISLTKVEERSVAHYVHLLHKSHQNVFVPWQSSLSKFPPSFIQGVMNSFFN